MEIDLRNRRFLGDFLPPHCTFVPWNPSLLEVHAETKFYSFRGELDSNVFSCLGDYAGCWFSGNDGWKEATPEAPLALGFATADSLLTFNCEST